MAHFKTFIFALFFSSAVLGTELVMPEPLQHEEGPFTQMCRQFAEYMRQREIYLADQKKEADLAVEAAKQQKKQEKLEKARIKRALKKQNNPKTDEKTDEKIVSSKKRKLDPQEGAIFRYLIIKKTT